MPSIVVYNKKYKLISCIRKIDEANKYLYLIFSKYCLNDSLLNSYIMFLTNRFFHYYILSQLKLMIFPFEGKI